MTSHVVQALCINLDRSTARWERMQRTVEEEFGSSLQLRRQPAVDGEREVTADRLPSLVSTYTRHALQNRLAICDHLQINNLAAIGCTLSHMECWKWLLQRPQLPWVLILEDDVCLKGLRRMLMTTLADVLWQPEPPPFDFLVLGYLTWWWYSYHTKSPEPPPILRDRARRMTGFWGSHCYVVTQAGARRLLDLALPIEVHVDAFLGLVCHQNDVHGYLLRESVAGQCKQFWNATIPHWQFSQLNVKLLLPDVSWLATAWFLLLLLLVTIAVIWSRSHRNR